MKVVIISAFDTFFDRVNLLRDYYEKKSAEVIVITSNYSHRLKDIYNNKDADIQIPVKKYKRNLSIDRLLSHWQFAKRTVTELNKIQPNIIHCIIPCNSLCQTVSQYKKNKTVKLIFDINDIWPEAMPVGSIKNKFPFTLWKNKRDKYIDNADLVLTECTYFQEVLGKLENPKWKTLLFAKKERESVSNPILSSETLDFCYLGSINNIIDIDLIIKFLNECNKRKPTTLHLVGGGEKKELLLNEARSHSIQVKDYGLLFDVKEKQKIFDQCHYALNVMKDFVMVGLTMKSMDYMLGSLPLVNTIKGDTAELCDKYDIGYNINQQGIDEAVTLISNESIQENLKKRKNVKEIYSSYFTQDVFNATLDKYNIL